MSLKDIEIDKSYISCGDKNIVDSLIGPALRNAKLYKRCAGYFSSSVFSSIADDIVMFVRKGGHIRLICGLELSNEDKTTIELGYKNRDTIISEGFGKSFYDSISELTDDNLQLLYDLVSNSYMDIRLAITKNSGIYHDKLGIIEDEEMNKIVFYGSANSTGAAYNDNYEKIRTAVSWKEGYNEIVSDEDQEFDNLWESNNPYVDVYDFTQKASSIIVKRINDNKNKKTSKITDLYDYQKAAIQAWVDNLYHGFYVMATGTGKTWTAIYSLKRLLEYESNIFTVIVAPYKHLIKQWREDVIDTFPDAKIIMVSSENPGWDNQITTEIIAQKYKKSNQIIVLSTIASFNTERFYNTLKKSSQKKLLIVDEAHRFTKLTKDIKNLFDYMLGLSATPGNGKNDEFVKELFTFFGGKVYDLPIEKALKWGYLVNYNYYPIYVHSTIEDEDAFVDLSHKMASCFENGRIIDSEKLARLSRARLRVISMASEKLDNINYILDQIKEEDHFVVYCGDGRLFDDNLSEEIRHIEFIKSVLDARDKKACQFTASENMEKRMALVEGFNRAEFDSLVAIRCLDEGINIPSIKGALILSSNDDYREFVQRRGRILRKYDNKKYANIYDVIVLPRRSNTSWASIELRRFYEYARLALNKDQQLNKLYSLLEDYNLSLDSIGTYTGEEREIDE